MPVNRLRFYEPNSDLTGQLGSGTTQLPDIHNPTPPPLNRRKRKIQDKATLQLVGATRLFSYEAPTEIMHSEGKCIFLYKDIIYDKNPISITFLSVFSVFIV